MSGPPEIVTPDWDLLGPLRQVPDGWWLIVRCRCPLVHMPGPLMTRRHGQAMTLADLLARWHCRRCGERPIAEAWVDDPSRSADGHTGPVQWRVGIGDH